MYNLFLHIRCTCLNIYLINFVTASLSKLSEEELNALIAHAHKRIDQLQRQLAQQQTLEKLRLEEALFRQKEEDAALHHVSINQEKDLWKNELDVIKARWVGILDLAGC